MIGIVKTNTTFLTAFQRHCENSSLCHAGFLLLWRKKLGPCPGDAQAEKWTRGSLRGFVLLFIFGVSPPTETVHGLSGDSTGDISSSSTQLLS